MKTSTVAGIVFLLCIVPSCALSQKITDDRFVEGRSLFQTNCSSCHSVHKEILGPQLASITKKRREEWLIAFIRNSQSMISGGDTYAQLLFEKYNHQVMPSFRSFSSEETRNVLHYIELESLHTSDDIQAGIDVQQTSNADIFHGQLIFQSQCASCHFIDHEGGFGPALGSVPKRHSKQWLTEFIRNSQTVIQSGDPYAVQIYNRFNHRQMVPMPFLKDDEISDVLAYIEFYASSDHATAGASGRTIQFGGQHAELHTVTNDRPIEGKIIIRALVIVLIAAASLVYVVVLFRAFTYLQADDTDAWNRDILKNEQSFDNE